MGHGHAKLENGLRGCDIPYGRALDSSVVPGLVHYVGFVP